MKRILMLGSIFSLCAVLVGCGPESQEGLIKETINQMDQAASDIDIINKKVAEATKNFEDGKTNKLDLSEAVKATKSLKETGEKLSPIIQRIEKIRNTISDDEKEAYAKSEKPRLAEVFQRLNDNREKLRKSLDAAEKVGKTQVDEFRKKLTEAESTFPVENRS